MPPASIVHCEREAGINTHSNSCGRMVCVFSSLSQNFNDQLSECDCSVHAVSLGFVGLGDNRVQSLIVKIHEDRIHALEDAVYRAIVQVQEPERPAVAGFALDLSHAKQVSKVQNVYIEMD